jgi:hypothetical protein
LGSRAYVEAMIKDATPWERIEFAAPKDAPKGKQPSEAYRLVVPGGWLVAHAWGENPGPLVFLPDPDHTWDPTT